MQQLPPDAGSTGRDDAEGPRRSDATGPGRSQPLRPGGATGPNVLQPVRRLQQGRPVESRTHLNGRTMAQQYRLLSSRPAPSGASPPPPPQANHPPTPMSTRAAGTRPRPRPPLVLIYLLGILGGVASIGTALFQNTMHYGLSLFAFGIVAAFVEELSKPIGLIIMLDKRPWWLRNRFEVIGMALLGALVFAGIENLMYIFILAEEITAAFVAWRLIICTALHLTATGVFAIGISRVWKRMQTRGEPFDLDKIFRWYLIAVIIHATYNVSVTVLSIVGVLRF